MPSQGFDALDLAVRIGLPLVTFFVGTAISAQRNSASDAVALLNELISDAKDLQQTATEYWVHDNAHGNARLNEAKIRGGCFSLSSAVNQWLETDGTLETELHGVLDDIVDLCTGGTFETANRAVDYSRAVDARNKCAELVSLARKERSKRNAPFSIFGDIHRWLSSRRCIRNVIKKLKQLRDFPRVSR